MVVGNHLCLLFHFILWGKVSHSNADMAIARLLLGVPLPQSLSSNKPPYLPGIQVGSGDLKSGPFSYTASAVATDWGVFLTWRGSSKGWANLHVYFLVYLCFTSPLFYVALLSWERSCQPWSKWSYDWGLVEWRENSWAGEIAQTWNCKGNLSL